MVQSVNPRQADGFGSLVGREWDIVVVGAGPAGAIAALEAARRGPSVLLVDKSGFPRYKVCGCCLNGRALETLQTVGQSDVVKQRGVAFDDVVLAVGGRRARVPLPTGVALSRKVLDATLVDAAIHQGATFQDECRAELCSPRQDGWLVTLSHGPNRGEVFAKLVLAADGLTHRLGPARQSDNVPRRASLVGAGVMLDDGVNAYKPGTVFLAVGRGGYVGMVRVEDGRLNVAAALHPWFIRQSKGLGPASVAVLHEAGCDVPQDLADVKWRGTPHLTRRVRHPSAHRLFVLGDAAGYVEPLTGEGMAWALESGREAASLACDSIEHFDAQSRARWERRHREIVGRARRRCTLIAAAARKPLLMKLAVTLLARTPQLAMPIIRSLNAPSHREAYR